MALFARKPKVRTCFLCSQAVELPLLEHYNTHLIAVTDNNGLAAYTFECPRCGLMDEAWGGGRSNPASNATSAIVVHLMQRHSVPLP